jgi:hypothetical protein
MADWVDWLSYGLPPYAAYPAVNMVQPPPWTKVLAFGRLEGARPGCAFGLIVAT